MPARVLFVDDDQMLLSSMERCLGLQFDLETATSGTVALRLLEEASEPFSVVISDMRMPVMDGVEFIKRAREVSKHTIFLMLTGNQDVHTAIRAVNEGEVFRFLNKPCDPADIASAIEHAHRQYDLETAERDLLNKTFVGAMGILGDVIEILQPELQGRAGRTEQFVEELRDRCGITPRWEYKIASKLSVVGQALSPTNGNASPTSERAREELLTACESASRVVERIPRLNLVAQIIRSVATSEGEVPALDPRGDGDVVRIGASLLRVAQLVESMSHIGLESDQAEADIQKTLPNIDPALLAAAGFIYPMESPNGGVPVEVEDLEPGMVLQNNLVSPDGATLLRAGRRLSQTHIDKLAADKKVCVEFPEVVITAGSYEAAAVALGR